MRETLKLTHLWLKNIKATSAMGVILGATLVSCFFKAIPLSLIFYGFLITTITESSMSSRIPYRFHLPVSTQGMVCSRLLVSVMFFFVQLALYIIAAIVRGMEPLSDLAIIVLTALNCFALFISFFYTKKRMVLTTIIIGAFCGILSNVFIIIVLSGGNIDMGLGLASIISMIIWVLMYVVAKKLIYKQYV